MENKIKLEKDGSIKILSVESDLIKALLEEGWTKLKDSKDKPKKKKEPTLSN